MPVISCSSIEGAFQPWGGGAYTLQHNVHAWRVDIPGLLHLTAEAGRILDEQELMRAAKYHQQGSAGRFTISRVALRWLLGKYLHMPGADIIFGKGQDGKPRVLNAGAKQVLFNVSHSGDVALIAFSSQPVGVDLEYIDPAFAFADVLPVCFSPKEAEAIAVSGALFYKFWTRKEAIRKATGKGVDDELHLVPCLDGTHIASGQAIGSEHDWQVSSFAMGEGYTASIATYPTPAAICFFDIGEIDLWPRLRGYAS